MSHRMSGPLFCKIMEKKPTRAPMYRLARRLHPRHSTGPSARVVF
jgi:hypothetical protein